MSSAITLPKPIRLSFPHLWEPKQVVMQGRPTGEPRYTAICVLPKDFDINPLKSLVLGAVAEKWPDPVKRPPMAALRLPLVTAEEELKDKVGELAGHWLLKVVAYPATPPVIVGPDGRQHQQHAPLDQGLIYPGAEAWVNITVRAYDTSSTSRGVSAYLNGVKLTGKDVGRLDSRPTVAQMFGDIPDATATAGAFGAPSDPWGDSGSMSEPAGAAADDSPW